MATAPTKVSYTEVGNTLVLPTTGLTTVNIAVLAGDLVIPWGGCEDNVAAGTLSLSLLGGLTGTLTIAQTDQTNNYAPCTIGTAPVTGSGNLQAKVVGTQGAANRRMNVGCFVYRNHDGVGVSGKSHQGAGTTPQNTLTTSDNSALACCLTDWAAINTARTYLSANGLPTEDGHFADGSSWHYDAFDYADVGGAGSKTIGESAPTGQTPNLLVVEVLAVAAVADNTTKPALAGMFTPQLRQDAWF